MPKKTIIQAKTLPEGSTADVGDLSLEQLAAVNWQVGWRASRRPKQTPPEGDWGEWGILAGRGFGKALCVDTPVPTISGWKRLGQIAVGDVLFDEQGRPTKVLATFDRTPARAYRLTFSDGNELDACDEHQWVTWTHRERKQYSRYGNKNCFPDDWAGFQGALRDRHGNTTGTYGPRVRTTQEIADTVRHSTRGDLNHCVPTTKPLQCTEAVLPINPYVLGVWLGGGHSANASVVIGRRDKDNMAALLSAEGHPVGAVWADGVSYTICGLFRLLVAAGLRGNKHIPAKYLRSSAAQRQALLQGLMDTDGGVDAARCVSFSNTDEALIDAVFELAASLGEKPKKEARQTHCTYKGKRTAGAPSWRVYWTPARFIPFRLKRKAARITLGGAQSKRNLHRMIVAVEPTGPKPMRCLTVDSPNALFLVGRGMIPTHNTRTGAEWLGERTYFSPHPTASAVIAPTQMDVKMTCFEGRAGLLSVIPAECVADYNRSELIITLTNGATIRGFSAEKADRLRGPEHEFIWADEIAAWVDGENVLDMALFGHRVGANPQLLWTTTPRPTPFVMKLVQPKAKRIITTGSTYENKANLPSKFLDKIAEKEGTKIGRQEIHAEILDPEEGGIVTRSQIRMWPHDKPLPAFDWIIYSLDTAFTEQTYDRKTTTADPTACSVWGVFLHGKRNNVMLLDCWEERLGLPDLVRRVKRERGVRYGQSDQRPVIKPIIGAATAHTIGRKPDVILIEDKGSGISLRQTLAAEDIYTTPYNPGRADKLARLHAVSPLFARRLIWMPESEKNPGKFKTWAEPLIAQLCSFKGEGSTEHDDHVDSTTQAMRLLMDTQMLSGKQDPDNNPEEIARTPGVGYNPYAATNENPYAA